MVERGRNFEQNNEAFAAPETSSEQSYIPAVEQPLPSQDQPVASSSENHPISQPEDITKTASIDAVASGAETLDTLDLQSLLETQFQQAGDDSESPTTKSDSNEQQSHAA
jgi:hypothetical protein